MSQNLSPGDLEQLMAEADELIEQINTDLLENMSEEHRIEVEKYKTVLKQAQSSLKGNAEQGKESDFGHGAKGMHEAIQEITRAMSELAKYLT